ncbi:threonine--tRNA ligase [Candidatus Pacearchaeota archaeon CG10_big_fil_rev_8_21_14_0_10_31_9]|nr:MAG: threonine--tRNA ligase [Candidatus Pacearchaeota archaeon CG10_big_fil_rev_8_21_14_0_10_31_9]PIZ82582.1 MAG: threonine--tRNA ligase [Candidatus Pacearchaeota archaeon CG_4_10_14_0_2_um_filter_05_32_18]
MKIISLHCDYIKFKPLKKALKQPENLTEERKKEIKIDECLVILTAVEKNDSLDLVKELVKNIENIAKQVKANAIVLYPYAHLSSNLSNPDIALDILEKTEGELKKLKYKVTRAPFGYYKEFELKVKGHPLSELSREIGERSISKETSDKKIIPEEKYDYKQLLREISKSKLDTSKLKDNDHRILGQKLDLFSFSEVAPGMVFWHNNGLVVYNELINYWMDLHMKSGYQIIKTPQILDSKLWKISGHWDKYKENNFSTKYESRDFLVKPMNCPGGILVYKNKPKSYKDLPLKMGELGVVHRTELSGVLSGLFRVIQFTQDDAHIFCTEDQIEPEIKSIMDLINKIYTKFNFSYTLELSTRPEKYIGDLKMWEKAEKILEETLNKNKIKYKINKGDGAFYGPKIDFHIKDSLGRTWQCATIQLDFSMPERFELTYMDKNNKEQRPIMLHRVIYGSLERFIGILLEHLNGALPVWLSPIQVRVINFTDRNNKYAGKIMEKLNEQGIRVDSDLSSVPLGGKIRDAELMKIPYIIVIGDKEEKEKTIALRKRGSKNIEQLSIDNFIKNIDKEIKERK